MEELMFQIDFCNKCVHGTDVFSDEFRSKAYPKLKPSEFFCAKWVRKFDREKLEKLHVFCEGKRSLGIEENWSPSKSIAELQQIIDETFDEFGDDNPNGGFESI